MQSAFTGFGAGVLNDLCIKTGKAIKWVLQCRCCIGDDYTGSGGIGKSEFGHFYTF